MSDAKKDWLAENLHVLISAAQIGYSEKGRGMVLVNADETPVEGAGHPCFFVPLADIPGDDDDALRMVRNYNPATQFVASLAKEGSISSYQIAIPRVTQA